jgi:hypothetical protein
LTLTYNLNKVIDFFNLLLASFLRSEAMNGNRYTATTPYLTGDACTQLDSTGALRLFQRISTTPAELVGAIPMVADVVNAIHWKELVTQLSDTNPSMNGTADPGNGEKASRFNHIHPVDTSRAPTSHAASATTYGVSSVTNYGHSMASGATPLAPAVTAVIGTDNGKFAREGHVHPTNFTATATDIKMNGVQAVGTLVTFARADHVHPVDTSRAPTDHGSTGTTYGIGSATVYGHVKADTTAPIINGTAAVGTDDGLYARGDHIHPVDTSRLAASSYTAADVLTKLKTVDTDTSGLNSNTLQSLDLVGVKEYCSRALGTQHYTNQANLSTFYASATGYLDVGENKIISGALSISNSGGVNVYILHMVQRSVSTLIRLYGMHATTGALLTLDIASDGNPVANQTYGLSIGWN